MTAVEFFSEELSSGTPWFVSWGSRTTSKQFSIHFPKKRDPSQSWRESSFRGLVPLHFTYPRRWSCFMLHYFGWVRETSQVCDGTYNPSSSMCDGTYTTPISSMSVSDVVCWCTSDLRSAPSRRVQKVEEVEDEKAKAIENISSIR